MRDFWWLLIVWTFTHIWLIPTIHGYRYRVLTTDVTDICNGQTCGSEPHSVCLATQDPAKVPFQKCADRGFYWLYMSNSDRQDIIDGHNGLRNRVALDHRHLLSNMNLLHWDKDLEVMARGWIGQCDSSKKDPCQFIYNTSFSVGQNVQFLSGHPKDDWMIKMVRNWYMEGRHIDRKVFDGKYFEVKQSHYTQLLWANSQFVGCAAASFNHGFMMACNYYPAGNIVGEPINRRGKPCSECSEDRASCSTVFHGLCGLDIYEGSNTIRLNIHCFWILVLVVLLYSIA